MVSQYKIGMDRHIPLQCNGQTGYLIGDLPVGKTLAVKYWFKHHIPLTLIMAAIVTVLRLKGVTE